MAFSFAFLGVWFSKSILSEYCPLSSSVVHDNLYKTPLMPFVLTGFVSSQDASQYVILWSLSGKKRGMHPSSTLSKHSPSRELGNSSAQKLAPTLLISIVIVRQSVAVSFLISKFWQRIFGMGRENRVWCFQSRYPADLDPLDGTPMHLSQTLLDLNTKDPSAWCLRGLYGSFMGISWSGWGLLRWPSEQRTLTHPYP